MSEKSFGKYLRDMRKNQDPPMTQEQLAKAIGRGKMAISQFENEKNSPPQGELLNSIIKALKLTPEQEATMRFLSSEARRTVPSDIEKYFFENPSICKAIRAAKETSVDDSFWRKLTDKIVNHNE